MKKILNFNDYSTNELFGFLNKKYEFDPRAKEVFKKLLDNIENLEVQEFADYRREVSLKDTENKESQDKETLKEGPNEKETEDLREARLMRVPRGKKIVQSETKVNQQKSFKQKYKKSDDVDVAVMKNYSKHRTSSKIWGTRKENSFSLSINNQHFISDERGKEGQLLVNPKIAEMYWNFLSDIGNAQAKFKKGNMRENEYDSEINRIKNKYSLELSKFK